MRCGAQIEGLFGTVLVCDDPPDHLGAHRTHGGTVFRETHDGTVFRETRRAPMRAVPERYATPVDHGDANHIAAFDNVMSDKDRVDHLTSAHGYTQLSVNRIDSTRGLEDVHDADHLRMTEARDEPEYDDLSSTVGRRRGVLRRAEAIVCGTDERAESYGGAEDSFDVIAELWTTILRRRVPALVAERWGPGRARDVATWLAELDLTPADVALMMDALKTARLIGNIDHADSWDDKAGYAACGWDKAVKP